MTTQKEHPDKAASIMTEQEIAFTAEVSRGISIACGQQLTQLNEIIAALQLENAAFRAWLDEEIEYLEDVYKFGDLTKHGEGSLEALKEAREALAQTLPTPGAVARLVEAAVALKEWQGSEWLSKAGHRGHEFSSAVEALQAEQSAALPGEGG